ncbi:hypothetical protein [Falsiroseomonas sp. HW251]|uniref:hypothetical protein n=1 Tax=Falsiroseomonas sp. HW251 TaxID=3390998 RepID=UPI003D31F25E
MNQARDTSAARAATRPVRRGGAVALMAVAVAGLLAALPASAQVGAMCQTAFGVCPSGVAPVGAPCFCFAPGRQDPGRIVAPGGPPPMAFSPFCRTYRGVCQINPTPVGSACGCFGDVGQVVPP